MANNPTINHVLLPNNTTYDVQDDYAIESITRSGNTFTATRRNGTTFTFDQKDDNTTYTLTQSQSDAHSIIFTDSAGNSATITIPDANTTYTIEADTTNNQIKLVPSSGSAVPITVPFATNATNAVNATKATQDESGNNIKGSYAASMSVDTTTNKIQLKNKNGIVLSEIDAPSSGNNYTFAEGSTNGAFEVTPDGENTQVVTIHGLGTAAFANIVSTYSATGTAPVNGTAVAAALATLPTPMTFQGTLGENGTITALPTASASTVGYTYRVIKDGTYAGQAAKDGDEFIGAEIPKNSGTYVWVYIPSGDEPSGTVTNIATGTGLTGGPISTSGTISHADTSSQASVSNSGRTYIQSITLDGMGHVTGLSSATETVTNTDRYVNSAAFADDTTANANNPVKMTLTRAGSDSATVIANIPKVSSSSAGVAPKGAAVSSQSQSTKFLREDGIWAAPSYTVNTDTKVTAVGNHYTPTADTSAQLSASASGGTAAWSIDVVQGVQLQRDAKGHVTGVSVTSGKIPANPNTDTKVTSVGNHYAPAEDSSAQLSADASSTTAATWNSTSLVTGVDIKRDAKGHVVGISVDSIKMPANPDTNNAVTQTASTGSANYEVLFSGTADNTTRTEGARKNSNLLFNPSTGNLQATQLNGVTIGDSPKFTDTNTWRGIQDNLTSSTNTTESLSAKQGYLLATGSARDSTKMPLAGGTFTGAVTFANGTKNVVGDDCAIGDFNISGTVGFQGQNGATAIGLLKYGETWGNSANYAKIGYDGTTISMSKALSVTGDVTATKFIGPLQGNADTATSATTATKDSSGAVIKDTYVKKAGDSMTGTLCMNSATGNYGEGIRINAGSGGYSSFTLGTEANSRQGISDCGFWIGTNRTNTSYQRKLYIAHNSSTASETYFYASSATDYSPSLQVGGIIACKGVVAANTTGSSTAGGLALHGTNPTSYGIAFRGTGNGGKHGYVQGDWAQYHYMAGADTRGWVFNAGASTGVASISRAGHMVLNGSLTVGGNAANTSGCRMVFNSTLNCLDFQFAS